ncbi:amidohydrolase family protein [Anaerobacillus sp. HL2]|nr:amidohydrolase family protein [Anaerobacillus sp. HL2]
MKESCELSKSFPLMADGRITTMLAPHAPYTCPPEFLQMIIEEAKRNNLPIHIHFRDKTRGFGTC